MALEKSVQISGGRGNWGIFQVTKETCTEAIRKEVEATVESNPSETTR